MSRLRFLPDRSATAKRLKLEKDDIAVLNGKLYVVKEIGMHYARLADLQTGALLGLAKLTDIRKFVPGEEQTPLEEMQSCGTFDLPKFKKQHR